MNSTGHCILSAEPTASWRKLVQDADYDGLYKECLMAIKSGHWLGNLLESLTIEILGQSSFTVELMLAKRSGPQDKEEEGIWHDDASRDLAFSLSLNDSPDLIEGGLIGLRRKDEPEAPSFIPTQKWGDLIVFHTGKRGWDHKVTRVTHGNRLVLVGWLTLNNDF